MRAAATLFVLTRLVSATWAARVPAIQGQLGLSPGALGLAVLGLEGGAIAGLPAGGALVARRGSRAVLRRLHAGHAFGVLAGGLGGTAAATADIPVHAHFAGVAAAALLLGELAAGAPVEEHRRADEGTSPVALRHAARPGAARREAMTRGWAAG